MARPQGKTCSVPPLVGYGGLAGDREGLRFSWVVQEGRSEEQPFEESSKESGRMSHVHIWGKKILGGGDSKCKGPRQECALPKDLRN